MPKALFFLAACSFIIACHKDVSKNDTNKTNTPTCKLVKMVQGTGIMDTIYLIKYDNLGRVSKILDSSYGTAPYDLITISYNGSSKLPASANLLGFDSVIFTYNAAGKISTSIERGVFDLKNVYDYVSDTVLKKINFYEWNSTSNNWDYDGADTVIIDGKKDMLQLKASPGNGTYTLLDDFTYTNVPNTLKGLIQFDNGGVLGIFDVFPEDWYYVESNFMVHTYNNTIGPDYRECSYNVDSLGNVSSSVVFFKASPTAPTTTVTTRKYFYECTK